MTSRRLARDRKQPNLALPAAANHANGGRPANVKLSTMVPAPAMPATSPATFLGKSLKAADPASRHNLADRSGVAIGIINRAAGNRPISAANLLRLCACLGVDPLTGDPVKQASVGEFDEMSLALAVRMTMQIRGHSYRAAAAAAVIPLTIFHRLAQGEIVAIAGVIAGCRYVGLHPFQYLKPIPSVPSIVSRETGIAA